VASGGFAAPPGAPSPGSSRAWGPCPTPGRDPVSGEIGGPGGELLDQRPAQLRPPPGARGEPDRPLAALVDEDGGAAHLRPVLLLLGEHPRPGRHGDLVVELTLVGDGVAGERAKT